ncbi:transcriptional regulator/sugar kinase [Desulfosporosinus acidiphilus SJ4]|uniref:Transcriptional regulator/sugar kinase n=1 Tax=Desulfosporosinus acidiphilus (strain DSM 22704 / JCM 16185 / SJ4) TaxID=646529 RepID=I4D2Q9_DESAJ|nr:ROK family transcriptional regulator [Desulfosporosinus acidiphilus]AFM40083.1 transcriptional regulator/sugar kinase [Desulfosporosinus acidiphilus SJ4]
MGEPIPVGSFQGMKSLNKSAILNVVREHGLISRAEIAKLTKLTPPTVTNLVGELIDAKLVVETDLGESTGGRKPILLRINSSAFRVVGVYAGPKKVKAVAATLDGNLVTQLEAKYEVNPTSEQFLETLADVIEKVIERATPNMEAVLGIGVGMHGLVDSQEGISIFAPHLNLRNIAIKAYLERKFNLPVEVENDIRAQAIGESWFGQGKCVSNFILFRVGTGVGAGIILDHQLYRGASYTAGEIGHTTIDINGPKCSCGNYGCLESMVGGTALALRAQHAIRLGKSSILEDMVKGNLELIDGKMLYLAAQQEDQVAIEVLEDTGRYLGIGIANLINSLNPSLIILSGGVFGSADFIMESLRKTVERRALEKPAQAVSIVISELGGNAIPIGAFTLVLKKIFTPTGLADGLFENTN